MNLIVSLMRVLVPTLSIVALLLAGCAGTPQSRFYTLTPMAQPQADKPTAAARTVAVNIAPVEIPDYLKRLQIVTRDGRNELKLAEFDRWAGSLSENIAVVLAENLSLLIGSEQVFVHPRAQTADPDYTLAVRVLQLDCMPGDKVQLKAQWTVLAGAERKETLTRISSVTEKLENKQYATMVTAVSRTLEQLSVEIAREIQSQSAGRQ